MADKPRVLPDDEHNRLLVSNVHPHEWKNPEPAPRYNLVVIGAGTAGLVTAAGAAGLGARVALVERHLMGGDCLNVGCVPSKAIIRSSRVAAEIAGAGRYGINVPKGAKADFSDIMERMRRLRAGISRHDSAVRFRDEMGVDIFLGDGRFTGSDTVEVDGKVLRFKKAIIATGARPFVPPIPGLAEAGYVTNETVFSLTELPARFVVIGGGPIGCELAQAFSRFGSEVSIIELGSQFLAREDPDAAAVLAKTFEKEGINIYLNAVVKEVGLAGSEKLVTIESGGATQTIKASEILVGAGRAPNVEGLNLEGVGVQYDKFGIKVDDRLRTANPRIYAAGDCCMKYKFTHAADSAARIVIQNALFMGRKKLSALTVPWCTYTDPEIAHVGQYERDLEAQEIPFDTYTMAFKEVDRAILDGEDEGFVKVHIKKGSDKILGATILARHAGDMISEISVAMAGSIGLGALAGVIHPYPTQAEAIRKLGDLYNRTRLTPFIKKLFKRWLSWTR
ncbi:mercuric reductase [Acidobacteriota bacterium]